MTTPRARLTGGKQCALRRGILFVGLMALATLGISAPASAAITPTSDANALAGAITGTTVSGATLSVSEPAPLSVPNGVGDSPLADFPTPGGGATYAILTSGNVALADDPNDEEGSGEDLNGGDTLDGSHGTRGDTAYDISTLAIPVTVPAGTNCLALEYRFLSEEFPEFVGDIYNDALIAEVDTSDWTTTASAISSPRDFAANTGAPVSVNGVGPTAVSPGESVGTTYDAATGLITTKTPITPGVHSVFLSMFDQGDQILDSAAFLDNLRFINESPTTCKPPEVAATLAGTPAVSQFAGGVSVGSSIKFKSPTKAVVTVTVPGPGTVTATDKQASGKVLRASASKKKKALIKTSKVTAAAAGPVKVTIKLSSAGKKVQRKKGKAQVKVKINFTPAGASASAATSTTKKVVFKK